MLVFFLSHISLLYCSILYKKATKRHFGLSPILACKEALIVGSASKTVHERTTESEAQGPLRLSSVNKKEE